MRPPMKFVIDKRHQVIYRFTVTIAPLTQKPCDLVCSFHFLDRGDR
jgi:hypothetical protein